MSETIGLRLRTPKGDIVEALVFVETARTL